MNKETTEPVQAPEKSMPDEIARMLREAEERGYNRGRQEAVNLALDKWETSVDLAPDLLTCPRRSFWD